MPMYQVYKYQGRKRIILATGFGLSWAIGERAAQPGSLLRFIGLKD